VAHHYASGAKDSTIEECVCSLREVHKDLERRADVIDGLPEQACPENKVTADLAAQRSLGLHPLVFAIDECQELFSHEDYGDEAEKLCTAIIKRGRALGIILLLATQRPDKDSMPTGVSGNVLVRFCLKVAGQTENDMVLGTSAYKNGVRATTFTDEDLGIGYLLGVSTEARIVRGYYVDNPAAGRIADRARAMREAAGTLSGYAAGEVDKTQPPTYDLLADILTVVPATEEKVWNSVVVDRSLTVWRRSALISTAPGLSKRTRPRRLSSQRCSSRSASRSTRSSRPWTARARTGAASSGITWWRPPRGSSAA
ncbi:hypothetical protein AB0O34_36705, partial [Sphaerisporangium sp. NPDC088356]